MNARKIGKVVKELTELSLEELEEAYKVSKSILEKETEEEIGKIDIDIITSGETQRQQIVSNSILKIIKNEETNGSEMVSINKIIEESLKQGINETIVNQIINHLEKKGELYKPRHNFVKSTGVKS